MNNQNKVENFYLTVFSYIISLFLGWQIFSFINIFFQLNEKRIQFSFEQWMGVQSTYYPIISIILVLLGIVLLNRNAIKQKYYLLNYPALKSMITWLAILIGGVFVNYLLFLFDIAQNFIELINFILTILCLNQLSKIFYVKNKLAWYHPTTQGSIIISVLLLGISQMLIFETINYPFTGYAYLLLILLIIENLRIFSRFKYLTKTSYETNKIARLLLGRYGIYFGVRVVAGIFMPIVYIIYALYANENLFQGVGALLIIGEFVERLLFIYLSDTPKTSN